MEDIKKKPLPAIKKAKGDVTGKCMKIEKRCVIKGNINKKFIKV